MCAVSFTIETATSPVQEWRGAELERRNKRKSVSASRQLDMILPRDSDEAARPDAELFASPSG